MKNESQVRYNEEGQLEILGAQIVNQALSFYSTCTTTALKLSTVVCSSTWSSMLTMTVI